MARRQEYPNALLGNAVKMEEDRMLVGQGPEEKNENLYLEKNRDSLNIVDIECGFSLNPFL